uniref:Uncharacterized protein n=1 Tax=Arundo donax TaxID=35708 RepID=A0A0A9FEY8_ARUDO
MRISSQLFTRKSVLPSMLVLLIWDILHF